METGKYTLNTGGNCIITAIVFESLRFVGVYDNFTDLPHVVRRINKGKFNYHGIRYNLSEFEKVK